jgi:hypothetical protein
MTAVSAPADAQLEVSENPVRSDRVVFSWPAGGGTARLAIYGFTGEQLHQATIVAPANEYSWNLALGRNARPIVNGAYVVVVDIDGRRYRRRLFIARPRPNP